MTTKEVLEIVESRGLKIVLKDGHPVLVKPNGGIVTDKLLAVLKVHRDRIIQEIKAGQHA